MNIEPIVWQASPRELFLKKGEAHVWRIQGAVENYLSPEEQLRADRFILPQDKARFILAHNGLRKILGKYIHELPQEIIFEKSSSGKPYLKNHTQIQFNLSHSENMILCAISQNPVGIDVEYTNKNIDYLALSKRFFSPKEYELIFSENNLENKKNLFFKLWTEKEAYYKTLGMGISAGLEKEIPNDFKIYHFIPAPHYLAAVGGGEKITTYDLT